MNLTPLLHWLLDNGIGQNVTASILLGAPTIALGWRKHKQHLQRIHDRLDQLHAHLARPRPLGDPETGHTTTTDETW